jgi:hypothetical protein
LRYCIALINALDYSYYIGGTKRPHTEDKKMKLEQNEFWQTQARGSNDSEYQIYLACADNGKGIDFTTGKPLKTYEEWLNS